MSRPLKLIVGIGNPGSRYSDTRHNVGIWFVERLANRFHLQFKTEKKFHGRLATAESGGEKVYILIPDTYMNESGRSVGPLANFFRISGAEILIAHDELDFPVGKIRFKEGGGLAGHNGLKDITRALAGDKSYNRLRIGVGHPGSKEDVTGHVLSKASPTDRRIIDLCIDHALDAIQPALLGQWQDAMNQLHNAPVAGSGPEA